MTSTWPTPAGEVQVMVVAFMTTTLVAALPPKETVAPATKPVPVIVTAVPPAAGPLLGLTDVTVGAVPTKVNWSPGGLAAEVAFSVVTNTSTVPAGSAGETAVRLVDETNTTLVPDTVPNLTVLPDVKLVPVIVTGV